MMRRLPTPLQRLGEIHICPLLHAVFMQPAPLPPRLAALICIPHARIRKERGRAKRPVRVHPEVRKRALVVIQPPFVVLHCGRCPARDVELVISAKGVHRVRHVVGVDAAWRLLFCRNGEVSGVFWGAVEEREEGYEGREGSHFLLVKLILQLSTGKPMFVPLLLGVLVSRVLAAIYSTEGFQVGKVALYSTWD